MLAIPKHANLPSLRIDGVRHELSVITILRRAELLPGGLPWSLEFVEEAAVRLLARSPTLRSGRPSPLLVSQLLVVLRKVLRPGGRPHFCVSNIDRLDIGSDRVRLSGRCSPLIIEAFGGGGLTRSCSWRR